jgi:SAM-dependent methyltransferase
MSITYVGTELDLFASATRWKGYLRRRISPYLGPEVLEVGAGLGGTTLALCRGDHRRWVCLEPDASLADRLRERIDSAELPPCCSIRGGTLADDRDPSAFDSILYVDVLEHIEDDASELERASDRLRPGGTLVVIAPAHPWLFTPFDTAIGHFRRYTRSTLSSIGPSGLDLVRVDYLDSVGLIASLGNRLILRRSMPGPWQVAAWDNLMVPLSRAIDPILGHRVGKSVMAVWRKPGIGS